MSEITTDYFNDPDVQRWLIKAESSEISGSGSVTATPWVMREGDLPAGLIDSDESTAEASGAPGLRASTDALGANQIPIEIVDFTPASGGAGGGATAEIWVYTATADADDGQNVYLWWNKSGKTQPAADAQYGSEAVWAQYEAAFNASSNPTGSSGDVPDSAGNHDGTSAGSMAALNAGPGSISNEWPFDGSNDEITFGAFDVNNSITFEFWANIPNTSTQYAIVGKHTGAGANQVVLLFESGGGLASIIGASSLRISGSSVTGDHYWYVTIEESGSDTVVKWYQDGVLQVTQTHTSVTIGDVSGGNEWVWGQEWDGGSKSDWFAQSMAAMRLRNDVDADAANLAVTQYNNQSDSASFWDTTAEVESGPFDDDPRFTWEFQGRERTWTVNLIDTEFAGDATTLCGAGEMIGRWGHRTNNFDERIRASEISLSVFDPDLTVYNLLTGSDKDESKFKLKLTDSTGTYTINMRIRLDETSTMLVSGLEKQVTRMYAYCSMADLENVDAITLSSSTIHNLFRLILASNGVSQNIEYYIAHSAENADAAGVILDIHRLNRLDLIYAQKGRKVDTMHDQLRGLLEGFGAVAINGMDGKWHVKHEYSLGETRTDRGAAFYDIVGGTMSTLATLEMESFTATDDIIERSTVRRPFRAIQAVQVERGNGRDFFTVDIMRHGDFEDAWESSTDQGWDVQSGSYSRSSQADTGSFSLALPSGTNKIRKQLLRFAGGRQDIDIELALRYSFESVDASTTVSGDTFVQIGYNTSALGVEYLGNGGAGWGLVTPAIDVNGSMVANGSSLVWATLVTTIYGPLPEVDGGILPSLDGDIRVYLWNASTNYTARFDTVEIRIKRADNALNDWNVVSGRYDISGNLEIKGDIAEQRVPWYNGLLGTDLANDGTRDEAVPMLQVLTTSAGSWVQAGRFETLVGGDTNKYADLAELTSTIRIARQDRTGEEIEGEIYGIVPHNVPIVRGSKTYLQQYTEIDFRTEVTSFVAREKISIVPDTPEPSYIYLATLTEITRVAVQASLPFTTEETLVSSFLTNYQVQDMEADEANDKLFALIYDTTDADHTRLYKYNLDGSAGTEILDHPTSDVWSGVCFCLMRGAQRIQVMEQRTDTNGFRIREFDYDGNLIGITYNQSSVFSFGMGLGISPSEDFLFFHENITSPSSRSLIRIDLVNGGSTSLGTPVNSANSSGGTDPNEIRIDSAYSNGVFACFGLDLIAFPYPDAPSQSIVTTNPGTDSLATDRFNQKLYYNGIGVGLGQQKIRRIGYDSSSDEEVFDKGANIIALSSGYN